MNGIDHVIDEVYQVNKSIHNNNNSAKEFSTRKRTRGEVNQTNNNNSNNNNNDTIDANNSTITMYEKTKLYVAMMQKDLFIIAQAVTTFGIQLLPALDAIVQRLSHLIFFTGNYTYHSVNDMSGQGVCLSCSKV